MERVPGYLLAIVILGLLVLGWIGDFAPEGAEVRTKGSDLIVIARTDVFGELERPVVPFEHGKHAEALKTEGCTACHAEVDGRLGLSFIGKTTADAVRDSYHERCTGCHARLSSAGRPSGPETCGGCHVRGIRFVSSRREAGLDLATHKIHVETKDGDCTACHKAMDAKVPRLLYEMGADLKGLPLEEAAHKACVGCHYEGARAGKDTPGPLRCSECHEEHAMPGWLVRPTGLPEGYRLIRGQEDAPVIYIGSEARLPEVPFLHKKHEGIVSSCRACHHNSLQSCGTCHTLQGSQEGKGVKLAKAYHAPSSTHSCVGCHKERTIGRDCRGCHGDDPTDRVPTEGSCLICHQRGTRPTPRPDVPAPPKEPTRIENRYGAGDRYGPTQFDHLTHVTRMRELIQGGKNHDLARRFHHGRQFFCSGCHHHSPKIEAGGKPPRCTYCHAERQDLDRPVRPLAPAAYHQRCSKCHERLTVGKDGKPLGCTDCHASREEKK